MAARNQPTIHAEAARACFINEHQLAPGRLQLAHRSPQRIAVAGDLTLMPNLATFLGNGDIDQPL
jgi:hypothetical protein